ncbi:MAG: hypothetical protein QW478_13350 [Candidatus Micrarchaeaceae archaeon]
MEARRLRFLIKYDDILNKLFIIPLYILSYMKRDIPNKLPIELSPSIFPGLPEPVRLINYNESEIMLRCRTCNQILPVSKALEHQLMHKNKGEDACFTVETVTSKRRIWYSENEII